MENLVICQMPDPPQWIGAAKEALGLIEFGLAAAVIALVITGYFLSKKDWTMVPGPVFVLNGLVYFALSIALVSILVSLPFPFVLILVPATGLTAFSLGMVPLGIMVLWLYSVKYEDSPQTISARYISYSLIVGYIAAGITFLVIGGMNFMAGVEDSNTVYHGTITHARTGEECFARGGVHYIVTEGDKTTQYFSDGSTKDFIRNENYDWVEVSDAPLEEGPEEQSSAGEALQHVVISRAGAYILAIPDEWTTEVVDSTDQADLLIYDKDRALVMKIRWPLLESGYPGNQIKDLGQLSTGIGGIQTNLHGTDESFTQGFVRYAWMGGEDFWNESFEIFVYYNRPYYKTETDRQSGSGIPSKYETFDEILGATPRTAATTQIEAIIAGIKHR